LISPTFGQATNTEPQKQDDEAKTAVTTDATKPVLTAVFPTVKAAEVEYRTDESVIKDAAKSSQDVSWFLSVLMLYLPGFLVTVIVLSSSLRNFFYFSAAATTVVAITGVVGMLIGPWPGLLLGWIAGAAGGLLSDQSNCMTLTQELSRVFGTVFPAALIGGLAGQNAAAGASLTPIWLYIGVFAGFCLLAAGLTLLARWLYQLYIQRRAESV